MRTAIRWITGMTGAVLALIALGTTPASAESTNFDIPSSITSKTQPSHAALEADTRSAADAKCVNKYGFRARGVTAVGWGGGAGHWQVTWRCDRN